MSYVLAHLLRSRWRIVSCHKNMMYLWGFRVFRNRTWKRTRPLDHLTQVTHLRQVDNSLVLVAIPVNGLVAMLCCFFIPNNDLYCRLATCTCIGTLVLLRIH